MQSKTQIFIEKAQKIHGVDRYDYCYSDYKNCDTKVKIKCNVCVIIFEQTPYNHLNRRYGCKICGYKTLSYTKTPTIEEFIQKAHKVHGVDRYGYSKSVYLKSKIQLLIDCNICGDVFKQRPSDHLQCKGCLKCGIQQGSQKKTMTTEEFVQRAKLVHGDSRYGYQQTLYKGCKNKVLINCNNCCLVFEQIADKHLQGHGCQTCRYKTETLVVQYLLTKYNVIQQKTYDDLKSPKQNPLRVDAYLPDFNIIVEIQGAQHFKQVRDWNLEKTQLYDQIKEQYCSVNKINLLTIQQEDIWNNEYRKSKPFNWRKIIDDFVEQSKQGIHMILKTGITIYSQ